MTYEKNMDEIKDTTLQKIRDNLWAIDQGFVRCFLIVGEKKGLLFDTGAAPCDMLGLIRSVTDKEILVVHSHGDGDHTANSCLFPVIYAHPAEFEVILRFRPELEGRLCPVVEGDSFDLGGQSLEVIETPGHTPGSICLLDRENQLLFSGDTISFGVFLFGDHRDIRTFRKTLDKLQTLGGYDKVFPCHGACPITPEIIPTLKAVVDGALDGSIQGTKTEGPPLPDGAEPLSYRVGDCEILYIP